MQRNLQGHIAKEPGQKQDPIAAQGKDLSPSFSWLLLPGIMALTVCLYSRVAFSDFLSIDDDTFILNNPLIKAPGWDGIQTLFTTNNLGKYQPFILLTWLLEYRAFGFDPVKFHLFNLALHLLNTWLAYKVAKQLSGKEITALVVAALFALHPMHVETVAWVSELKDTLPAFFYLSALWCYLLYLDSGFKPKYLVGLLILFSAALLSKFACISLPAILLLIDVYRGRALHKRVWMEKVPIIALSLFFLVLGTMSKNATGEFGMIPATHNFINRVFLFTYVPSFYVVKLIAPFHLAAMHYYPQLQHGMLPWEYYASLPFLVAVVWLVTRNYRLKKEVTFGVVFFLITIAVMEQIMSIGPALTPERYTYIPYFGFFYVIGQGLSSIDARRWKKIAAGVVAGMLLLFGVITWSRVPVWKNDDTIFWDIIDKNSGNRECYYPYFVLGKVKHTVGRLNEALQDYNESIALNPRFAGVYDNRGGLYFQANDLKSALLDFNTAIRLDPQRASAYNNRATLKATTGDYKGAIADYDAFLQMKPENKRAYGDRGMARLNAGDTLHACKDFKTSLQYGNGEAAVLLEQYCH